MTVDRSPWRCEKCHAEIGAGLVLVFNANPQLDAVGAYPSVASPDFPPDRFTDSAAVARDPDVATMRERQKYQVDDALWDINRPVNVGFGAFCSGCDTYSALGAYQIPATPSAASWLAWVLHLGEKTWMGSWDRERMIAYWFTNRGLDPGHYI